MSAESYDERLASWLDSLAEDAPEPESARFSEKPIRFILESVAGVMMLLVYAACIILFASSIALTVADFSTEVLMLTVLTAIAMAWSGYTFFMKTAWGRDFTNGTKYAIERLDQWLVDRLPDRLGFGANGGNN